MSISSLLSRMERIATRGSATTLHVFDVRIGQTNLALVGIRRNHDGGWTLDRIFVSASRLSEIVKRMREAFAQSRLLKMEVLQLQGGRITVINGVGPSEITVGEFVRMVDEGRVNGSKQLRVIHAVGRIVEVQGLRTIFTFRGVPIQLRTFRSSVWLSLMLDAFREGEADAWDMVMVITISPQAAVQHSIYEITDEKLIEYGSSGAFTLYAALPISPATSTSEAVGEAPPEEIEPLEGAEQRSAALRAPSLAGAAVGGGSNGGPSVAPAPSAGGGEDAELRRLVEAMVSEARRIAELALDERGA